MRLFVTGGAGFIGSHYVRSVLAGRYPGVENAHVTVLDKLTYAGNLANIPVEHPRLTLVRGDICDGELLMRLLPGHHAVVHFAAESHVDRSIVRSAQFIATNVVGTHTMLECCLRAGVRRFVHVSTDEVYGSIDEGAWPEDHPLEPNSPYAASKAASDLIVRAFHKGETYNIGGGTELTNLELTRLLLDACDADWERVRYVPDRKGHDRRYALNGSKIAEELGFRPRVPFSQGLADTVRWYGANRAWWEPVKRHRAVVDAPA